MKSRFRFLYLLALLPAMGLADVRVVRGPTPIQNGDARAPGDITVINERLAFALAVETSAPYGVPRGAIVDIAPVSDGVIGRDRVVFADFIPNNWSAWPNTRQQVEILDPGPDQVVLRSTRDWGKATVTTIYTLKRNADAIQMQTTLRNDGDTPLENLLSGMTLWPSAGFLFAVPGLAGVTEGSAGSAVSDRVVAYDEDWSIALHAPYFDHIGYGSKDMFRRHSLAPGESRQFDAQLQVGSSGNLAPIVQSEIERRQLPSGELHGRAMSTDGRAIDQPIVVVERLGKPYAWVLGHAGTFSIRLPAGDYSLYATAKNHSQSPSIDVSVAAGSTRELSFQRIGFPGRIDVQVTRSKDHAPLDARMSIKEGQKPVAEFLGKNVFFTELDRKGRTEITIAPGHYRFEIASGGGFVGAPVEVPVDVVPGRTTRALVELPILFDPEAQGWYCADLHHHADQAEAVTPPADLARSQLAAGLDLLFVSDHDSTVNHHALQKIAAQLAVPFVPGIEISPSWGHFNAYPLNPGQTLSIDTSRAGIDEVLADARRMGAIDVQVNHPFIPFGYLTSVNGGVAPGGFNPGFDLLEMNAAEKGDEQVLKTLESFWNAGHRYYLTAGTDTHDVWKGRSGGIRVYAHVDGHLDAVSFAKSLRDGHAYVTYGPLMFPTVMFGDTVHVKPGQPLSLGVDLKSVAGLAQVELRSGGSSVDSRRFENFPNEARVDFTVKSPTSTWYSLVVTDKEGKKAYSDPVWADAVHF